MFYTYILIVFWVLTAIMRKFAPQIYDVIIIHMTKLWYKVVLEKIPQGSSVLDVGVGTATALIENKLLVESKKLTIVGVDYDQSYINAAIQNLSKAGLENCTEMHCKSVYDDDLGQVLSQGKVKGMFDAVYFSGSWSLMPNPVEAVRVAGKLLKDDGLVYITQTFQKQPSFFFKVVKPMLKYVTTIDFGQLHLITDMEGYLKETAEKVAGVSYKVLERDLVPGSIDNQFQSAFLIILKKTKA
mmetsp:Transcript_690/g.926  ORF Transcript_690/g.926 Transcript_690/m.926 type:complete len:242 (-) Transcript_690:2175-2900(-)